MSIRNKISFNYLYNHFSFTNRNKLKNFIIHLFKNEGYAVDYVQFIFCNDEYLLNLNMTFLNHNTLTDILTFDLSTSDNPIQAEIYISIDRIKENSKLFDTHFTIELYRVIFHGALHLCGYNDKDARSKKAMTLKEDFYLNRYFVSRETL